MSSTTSSPGLSVTYDRNSDVLYVSRRPGVPARSREEAPGVVWRYAVGRRDLIGVTIVDFVTYWGQRRSELAKQIAVRFAVSREEVQDMLDRASK